MESIIPLHEQYRELILGKRLLEFQQLLSRSQEPPSDYIVHIGYRTYVKEARLKRVQLFYLVKLYEITRIPPENRVIQEVCDITLENSNLAIFEVTARRLEVKRELFTEMKHFFQGKYEKYMDAGRFADLSRMMEISGTAPTVESVQHWYRKYLESGKLISFVGLKKRTGIEPDPRMVDEVLLRYQENLARTADGDEVRLWQDRIDRLKRLAEAKAELPPQDQANPVVSG